MDGGKKNERLIQVAEALADGSTPDWDDLLAPGDDTDRLEELRHLEQIAQAFQVGSPTADHGPVQFIWKHLEVYDLIGRGGFGEVFRAFDPALQREVALKLRREALADEDPLPDRIFIQEARRLARIRHPHVLAIHGADVDNGRVGLWSDLVPGESLMDHIEREPLAADAVLVIAAALCDALATIHRAGLVHGDIKSTNVMLQPDGAPVLMDFGAAVERGRYGHSAAAGSPLVMAPELLDGSAPSAASDQYSLGVLLYQTLTGRYPLEAETLDGLLERHRDGASIDWTSVPRLFRKVLRRLLSGDPSRRPSATETSLLIDEIRTRPLRRRRHIAVGAIIASLAIGLTVAGLGLLEAKRSERAALAAQAEAEDVTRFMVRLLQAPSGYTRGPRSLVIDLLNDAATELELSPPENPLRAARFRLALGRTLSALDAHERALALLDQALTELDRDDTRAQERISALLAMGVHADRTGEEPRAAELFARARALAETHLGPKHRLTVESIYLQGRMFSILDNAQPAREVLEEALARSSDLPQDEDLPALIQAALAAQLRDQSELDEAERLARAAETYLLRVHSPTHVNVMMARETLSTILIEQGHFDQAEEVLRANLAMIQERVPEGSFRTASVLSTLSTALDRQGKEEEAMIVNQQSLDLLTRVRGPTHPQTLAAVSNHAVRLYELGRFDESEAAYREVIERSAEAMGPEHPLVLINRGNLAELLMVGGRLNESEALARSTLEIDQRKLGETHMFSLFVMDILGASLTRMGRLEEGLEVLEKVYSLKHQELGPDNPYTMDSAAYLAEALIEAGDRPRARELLEAVMASRTRLNGAEDPDTREAEALLARTRED